MYPFEPNLHSLVTDAGESVRAVADSYPAWIEGEVPGRYYALVSLSIIPLPFAARWQTLSQWEPVLESDRC